MSFSKKIAQVPTLQSCLKVGLKALKGEDKSKIDVKDPRSLNGSVNLDSCFKNQYPNENRWDYLIGYKQEAFFVEVHPAETSEVKAMENKLNWLKEWKKNTPFAKDNRYFWIPSGRVAISKNSNYFRRIAQLGIKLEPSPLCLDKYL